MDQCEDTKTTLCGEHESQSKAQRNQAGSAAESGPEPSCVSFKSNRSKDRFIHFQHDVPSDKHSFQRPESEPEPESESEYESASETEPEPSCVSMRSDRSKGHLINFKSDQRSRSLSFQRPEPEPEPEPESESEYESASEPEPEPSCVSMRSDRSKGHLINFKSDQRSQSLSFIRVSNHLKSQRHEVWVWCLCELHTDNVNKILT
ncbi:uncharacterized protein [Leuresthes tenuis]|uniref:uncharacterized protein isoform X1 n=1 Tax=Leuresthes tenuis TaxID=355514 RepID=UPI003B50991E